MSNTLQEENRQILKSIPALINKTFPIPGRFKSALPSQIAELSGLLTNERGNRPLSYLNRPNFLSAYLHYFLPWNLYRLCIVLNNLNIPLNPGDIITDLGSGPLTFVSALWITRPDIRGIPLEINCIDRSAPALEAGLKFFKEISKNSTWKINLLREEIDIRRPEIKGIKKKSSLLCAVNLFNEIYEKLPHNNTVKLKRIAENIAQTACSHISQNAYILTVEPGVPQSGRFISFLRAALMELGQRPLLPCTHTLKCPFSDSKKWCHFAFETVDAPRELHLLSAAARLPKKRLVFSYLLTGGPQAKTASPYNVYEPSVRVISDAFVLPGKKLGRYGCSGQGLILLTGDKRNIEKINSNDILPIKKINGHDLKSGALIMEVN